MNGEMTITQHNEQLVLEKQRLLAQMENERNQMGLIVAGIMRQMKRKTIKLKAVNICPPGVAMDFQDDGGVHITFIQPNPNGAVGEIKKDEQPTDSPS